MNPPGARISRERLAEDLRRLGLEAGDGVVVHSSFKSLGPIEGGPPAVIEALLDAVGPDGNLMLPTFNYTGPVLSPYWDVSVPCRTGIIPETGRRHPRAVRSLHPSHSVAVIGPRAEELAANHLDSTAVGLGSPLDRLAATGGKVLLLGVDHTSNSTIHVGEEHARRPKAWAEPPRHRVLMPGGAVRDVEIDPSPSCGRGFAALAGPLEENGEVAAGPVGVSRAMLMSGREVIRRVVAVLGGRPDALLCDRPDCASCSAIRARLPS